MAGPLGELGLWGELVENYRRAGVKPGDPHAANMALGLLMTGKGEEAERLVERRTFCEECDRISHSSR